MNCPNCQADDNRVTDKRNWKNAFLVGTRRRRECRHCHHRFTTIEVIARHAPDGAIIPPTVFGGNGRKPAPTPKPQKALTAKEKDLKKRLAMALHRARCRAVVIEDEDLR